MSSTHETCGCSTKNLGSVMGFLDSILVAFVCHGLVCLRNHLDGIAILQELSADGDHSLAGLDSLDGNRIVMGRPQLNFAQVGDERAGALLRYHHRKLIGFRGNGTMALSRDRDGRMRNFAETDRSDHAGLQTTVAIVHGHFNGEDSVSRIGSWGDACDPPLHRKRRHSLS